MRSQLLGAPTSMAFEIVATEGRALVGPGVQVIGDGVVGVGGRHEGLHRQAHRPRQQAGAEVAEVAAGDGDHRRLGDPPAAELRHRLGVVEGLRQEAGDVDRVRRGQAVAGRERGVREGGLDQRLAVVEGAVDGEGGDVLAQGRELPLLEGGDPAARVEHHGPHPAPLPERLRHRRPGVAAGGGEDGDRMLRIADQLEHGGEEAGAEVLEGQGRPVEQLEGEDAGAAPPPAARGSRAPGARRAASGSRPSSSASRRSIRTSQRRLQSSSSSSGQSSKRGRGSGSQRPPPGAIPASTASRKVAVAGVPRADQSHAVLKLRAPARPGGRACRGGRSTSRPAPRSPPWSASATLAGRARGDSATAKRAGPEPESVHPQAPASIAAAWAARKPGTSGAR